MSLVVFPFKDEDVDVVTRNLATATRNFHVDEVWAIAAGEGPVTDSIRHRAAEVASAESKPVRVLPQERIGERRRGKGDAMNTAIREAARRGRERVHFYDADIVNFDDSWIDGAEMAADRGFGVVRHRFPRAATDAMITWMVTRPGLARLFPGTFLPRLDQPLGGELLLTGPALEALAGSDLVASRSDWGIDTVITYATSVLDVGVYEHHVPDGKRHGLYGSLLELRDMVLECLDAMSSLHGLPGPGPGAMHDSDPPGPVPDDLKRTVAYDVEATATLARMPPTSGEARLAAGLPDPVPDILVGGGSPRLADIDEDAWYRIHGHLLAGFVLGDPDWESLVFRLWVLRVLSYTTGPGRLGYDRAIDYLAGTIRKYEQAALIETEPGRSA